MALLTTTKSPAIACAFDLAEMMYKKNKAAGHGSTPENPSRVGLSRPQLLWLADLVRKEGNRTGVLTKAGFGHTYKVLNDTPPRGMRRTAPGWRYFAGELRLYPAPVVK